MTWSFLFKNRIRIGIASGKSLRRWARRIYTVREVGTYVLRASLLRWRGAQIADSAVLSKVDIQGPARNVAIGKYCSIGRADFRCLAMITLQDYVVVNDGVRLLAGSHDCDSSTFEHLHKPIELRSYSWIATGATILPGVVIGEYAIVAAGSVVAKDVPDRCIVAGNPARIIKQRAAIPYCYHPSRWFGGVEAWVGRDVPDCAENPAPKLKPLF